MISEIQTAYGSFVRRHGKSRWNCLNQASSSLRRVLISAVVSIAGRILPQKLRHALGSQHCQPFSWGCPAADSQSQNRTAMPSALPYWWFKQLKMNQLLDSP